MIIRQLCVNKIKEISSYDVCSIYLLHWQGEEAIIKQLCSINEAPKPLVKDGRFIPTRINIPTVRRDLHWILNIGIIKNSSTQLSLHLMILVKILLGWIWSYLPDGLHLRWRPAPDPSKLWQSERHLPSWEPLLEVFYQEPAKSYIEFGGTKMWGWWPVVCSMLVQSPATLMSAELFTAPLLQTALHHWQAVHRFPLHRAHTHRNQRYLGAFACSWFTCNVKTINFLQKNKSFTTKGSGFHTTIH